MRATWNLFNLLSGPANVRVAERGLEVAQARRMALSMAVVAQLNVARLHYDRSLETYRSNEEISRISERISRLSAGAQRASTGNELDRIRRSVVALAAQLERDRSLSELHGAVANLWTSLGVDLLPASVETAD